MREVALLSLVHHPSVPRLYGHGFWRHPSGTAFPFVVMQWVEGTPLYEWAREHSPSQRKVVQVLAHLARALQATHEASAVHRDLKGENVLVRSSDGRAVPTDFGAGRELNPQVDPQLSALSLRMLSLDPGARGTAEELAKALEALVEHGPQEEARVAEPAPPEAAEAAKVPTPIQPVRSRVRVRAVAVSALTLVGVFLVLWAWRMVQVLPEGASSKEQLASRPGKPDAGSADLGDAATATPPVSVRETSKKEAIGQDLPPEPLPGQLRPDAKGQCPGPKQVPINGGCWVEYPAANAEECAQNSMVPFKNRCYGPAMKSRRKPPPTSDHPQ